MCKELKGHVLFFFLELTATGLFCKNRTQLKVIHSRQVISSHAIQQETSSQPYHVNTLYQQFYYKLGRRTPQNVCNICIVLTVSRAQMRIASGNIKYRLLLYGPCRISITYTTRLNDKLTILSSK